MTLLRGAEIDRFLERPDATRPVVLLFGPDVGSVSERADGLAAHLAGDDPHAVARFDESELAAEPGRLAEEVFAPTLFSARKVIRIRTGGNRSISTDLKAVLDQPASDNWVVIEAGDLRKTAPLRKLCEGSPRAIAIGCYPDNDVSLGRLIDGAVGSAGLTIDPDARAALVNLLGADRAASRAEIEKLCLYARDAGAITFADVAAVVGDGAAFAIDDIIDAAASGDVNAVDRGLGRLLAAGTGSSTIGIAAERKFFQLHRMRSAVEAGASVNETLQAVRPPLFPSKRAAAERQLRLWPLDALNDALGQIDRAMIDSRLHPAVADQVVGRTLLSIAAQARRRTRGA